MTPLWHQIFDPHLRERPDAPALRDSTGMEWSYADLDRACTAVQETLSGMGVKPGDRVLVLCENSCAAVAALFGASRAGACVIPVNARMTAHEVDRIRTHARPSAVLTTSGASAEAAAHGERLGAVRQTGALGELMVAPDDGDGEAVDADVAVLLYTTGTTGTPKGVMLTHGNLTYAGRAAQEFRSLAPGHIVFGVAPITHVIGLASMLTATLTAGATALLEARFSVERLEAALRAGVSHLPAVPQMHALLMRHVQDQGLDRLESPDLFYVSSGGAPLDPAWKRKAEAFYGLPLQNGYGMTETTAATHITRNKLGDPDISVGPPLAEVEMRIDTDVPGAGDGAGEVIVRGPNVMKGYFRNPEATAAALSPDGWLRTGDLGRVDAEGRLHIMSRTKELIIHGGFNVYPPEVEAALNDHPQVVQSAVIGRVEDGDEKVLAFCQVPVGCDLTPEALRDFVAERLTGYKRPSRIILASSLPAAPTGKILKHKLLEAFADRLG
ncbi:class I adenylate-forming enzyme family protein [Aestuariivita boseongensis]|uniref:class I adenylate-forming enzyme family protein n=1 Tax=Aestuariivita boseongensis TaxID=1470562 RepID=UPI0006801B52|nr:class I adenylate-forming enzyme family protein [Aestuariivita boseongensis]